MNGFPRFHHGGLLVLRAFGFCLWSAAVSSLFFFFQASLAPHISADFQQVIRDLSLMPWCDDTALRNLRPPPRSRLLVRSSPLIFPLPPHFHNPFPPLLGTGCWKRSLHPLNSPPPFLVSLFRCLQDVQIPIQVVEFHRDLESSLPPSRLPLIYNGLPVLAGPSSWALFKVLLLYLPF